jgi:hypothetical protein
MMATSDDPKPERAILQTVMNVEVWVDPLLRPGTVELRDLNGRVLTKASGVKKIFVGQL